MEHEHTHTEGSEHDAEHLEAHQHEEHQPKRKRRFVQNRKSLIIIIVAVIVIVIAAGLTWLYTGKLSQAKEKVFKAIPLPAAIVDMKFIPTKEVLSRIDLANQLLASSGGDTTNSASQTYDQIIDAKKLQAIADQKHIAVTQAQIDEEYGNIIKQYANGDENAFKTELDQSYHMTPDQFKADVVYQEILQGNIALWYNQQKDLNKGAFDKANDLLNKLSSGQSFDDVSKAYTADAATKDFAGDSGMIAYSDLLPEFRDQLNDAKVGDTKLVTSRYGLHILKVLELNNDGPNGAKQIHLQQIFVQPVGFDDWLSKQNDGVRVIKLLKF